MNRGSLLMLVVLLPLAVAACGGGEDELFDAAALEVPEPEGAVSDSTARWNTVLARVGGIPITATDVLNHMRLSVGDERAEAQMTNPDMMQVALSALMDQYLWALTAAEDGFTLTRDERARVAAFKAELLATRYVGDVVQHKADPPEEEVRAWYDEHQAEFLSEVRVGIRHIQVEDEALARSLADRAAAGESFSDLAARYSTDENTKDIGGALGFVQERQPVLGLGTDTRFINAVLILEPGDIEVVPSHLGWHVVRVERKEGGDLLPYEEVRDDIVRGLRRERFSTFYNDELARQRENFEARMVEDGIAAFTGLSGGVERFLQAAREHPDPEGRIEYWRRISFDFPDSPEAPRAQFMVAWVNLVELQDVPAARKALARLQRVFGDSDWARAGSILADNLDIEDPSVLGTPEELLEAATGGN